jgi:hypothetical protein
MGSVELRPKMLMPDWHHVCGRQNSPAEAIAKTGQRWRSKEKGVPPLHLGSIPSYWSGHRQGVLVFEAELAECGNP